MEKKMKFCQSCGMPLTDEMLGMNADEMCQAERLYHKGRLPKRICQCAATTR